MKKIFGLCGIVILSLFVLGGCTSKNSVRLGDIVSLSYTATFPDGQIFDQNISQTPLIFTVGSGQVIPGLDEGVIGIKVGSTKTITVSPKKGYGDRYDKNKIQKISQLIFDKLSIKVEDGTIQKLGNIEGIVQGTEKDSEGNILVLFDINPRETRENLIYKVTVLEKK